MATKKVDRTLLKSMTVKNFRNMQDVNFELGKRITVVSGKNGTAKSTILGLVAQIFNFEKDVIKNKSLDFKALDDKAFKSQFSEHFRLSDKFDKPGEMDVRYNVYDAYFQKDINDLKLTMTATQGRKHRTVVRNNLPTPHSSNTSRNVTHPVIYLSLKRLLPISERENDTVNNISYLQDNREEFTNYCNEIVGKIEGTNITSTKGLVDSSVVHGDNYDHQAVSTGEDNVGQIVQALFSFKRLKEDYSDYHGGLKVREDYSWNEIYNELLVRTNRVGDDLKLPKVNIYFEDSEALDLFKRLIKINKLRNIINPLKDVSMGCKTYTSLVKSKVPEFASRSMLVLDADVEIDTNKYSNVILLPSSQPPDRLLFYFLLSLSRDDKFWNNSLQFTKDIFISLTNVSTIVSRLHIDENTSPEEFDAAVDTDLKDQNKNGLRDLFKGFYKDQEIQSLLSKVSTNPFEQYLKYNPDVRENFEKEFVGKLSKVLIEGLGAPKAEVHMYLSS